jgi:methionine-rich copper-binding protein CopC
MRQLVLFSFVAWGLFSALPNLAFCHAIVIASDPAAGSILPSAPFEATIRFNNRIDVARSNLVVLDASRQITALTVRPVSDPDVMAGSVPPLRPGRYRLRWQVLALDGHITRGDIPFSVQE